VIILKKKKTLILIYIDVNNMVVYQCGTYYIYFDISVMCATINTMYFTL
jgi:hypothetical protein